MQMNRLKYEKGEAVKVNTPLKIEPVIYADRFMIENREQSEKLRKLVHSLRDKIKHLESCLESYKNFAGSEYDI